MLIVDSGNEIKMSFGYDALGICGDFEVFSKDSIDNNHVSAVIACLEICPTCSLPTLAELDCICQNKNSFGGNFSGNYWSSNAYLGISHWYVDLDTCNHGILPSTTSINVRCVRR